ncbi:Centromere protein mis12 [Schizosaccharomyces pombe]
MLVELLEFTPLSFIDDVINITNQLLYKGVNGVDKAFSQTRFAKKAPQEIEEGLHKFEVLFESVVDRYYDGFEVYTLRNIFSYPPELKGYMRTFGKDVDYSITTEQDAAMDQAIQEAAEKLVVKMQLRRDLRMRLSRKREKKTEIEKHLERISFLNKVPENWQVTLPETTDFLLDQLGNLQHAVKRVVEASPTVHSREVDERITYLEKGYERLSNPIDQQKDFWSHHLSKLESTANTETANNIHKLLLSSEKDVGDTDEP